jgi:hypothetical protein
MVVRARVCSPGSKRNRVPFDNLDQVGAFGVGQRVLLRPRQEMERGIVGGFADTGLGLTRTQRHGSGDSAKKSPRQESQRGKFHVDRPPADGTGAHCPWGLMVGKVRFF